MAKSGALAAVLNFFIWGLGYLYLGKKTTFGLILVIGSIVTIAAIGLPIGSPGPQIYVADFGYLVVAIAFAYDANELAKSEKMSMMQPAQAPVAPQQPQQATTARYCRNCGAPARMDSKFCDKCGTQL
ncbi:MAG TPA: zinc ribbon domain-containing protein [Nitrososphaerales archaeon]|nr:zinc ribbon domain-containing protein [Nitrososphaerales archaeon]